MLTDTEVAEPVQEATHPNQAVIDGLRAMADWLEANPIKKYFLAPYIPLYFDSKEAVLTAIRGVGKVEKHVKGDWFEFRKAFEGDVRIEYNVERHVICERVKTGTRVVPAEPERTVTLPGKDEQIEDVFEWRCPDSILRPDQQFAEPPPEAVKTGVLN